MNVRTVVSLVVAAVIVVGLAAWGIGKYSEAKERERWMPVVEPLIDRVKFGEAQIHQYGGYGEMRELEEPVLVWSLNENVPHTFGVDVANLPSIPMACETVIFVKTRVVEAGHYVDDSGSSVAGAYQEIADVYVVNVEGPELVFATRFVGAPPPDVVDEYTEIEDRSAVSRVRAWLQTQVGL